MKERHVSFIFIVKSQYESFDYFSFLLFSCYFIQINLKIMQSEKKRKTTDDQTDIRSKFIKSTTDTPVASTPPTVVHLRRSKGKIIQDCDVYIGRVCNMGGWRLNQSKWHNPYSVKQYGRDGALNRYRTYIESNTNNLLNDLHELDGKSLGCWCKPSPCHGDILRELFKKQVQQSDKTL